MQKERRILSVSSNRPRVSPYPLRSCRNDKQKGPESSFQSEGARQWEDVRCVICMEPPHNAVLLHCSSFSKGCRPYMCDTSVRHSNCFKQYRRNNTNRYNSKTLNCPLCRGEVYETKKVTSARRFMNAKPRCCSMDDCEFSGSYSQLKNHLKIEHPGFTPPKIDSWKQSMWEQMEREAEYMELLSAAEIQHRRWAAEERQEGVQPLQYSHHPVIQVSFDGVIRTLLGGTEVQDQARNHLSAASFSAFMPRLEIRTTMLHGLIP